MGNGQKANKKSYGAAVAVPVVIILLPLLLSVFSFLFAQEDGAKEVFLQKPAARFKECVRDTEYMRHNHWVLLRAVREDVVRHGKRGDVSLRRCRDCHTSRVQFCDKCHNAVSMTPDCYGCHYYP